MRGRRSGALNQHPRPNRQHLFDPQFPHDEDLVVDPERRVETHAIEAAASHITAQLALDIVKLAENTDERIAGVHALLYLLDVVEHHLLTGTALVAKQEIVRQCPRLGIEEHRLKSVAAVRIDLGRDKLLEWEHSLGRQKVEVVAAVVADCSRAPAHDRVRVHLRESLHQPDRKPTGCQAGDQMKVLVIHDLVAFATTDVGPEHDVMSEGPGPVDTGRRAPSEILQLRKKRLEGVLVGHRENHERPVRVGRGAGKRSLKDPADDLELEGDPARLLGSGVAGDREVRTGHLHPVLGIGTRGGEADDEDQAPDQPQGRTKSPDSPIVSTRRSPRSARCRHPMGRSGTRS